MDKVIVTQAAMDAAADFLEAWEPGPEMTVVKLARAFDAFAAQQQVEPVPVAWMYERAGYQTYLHNARIPEQLSKWTETPLYAHPPVPVWQPIESAPEVKGKYFHCYLAWGPDWDKCTGQGFRWDGRWFVGASFHKNVPVDQCQNEIRQIEVNPTHWMPLPAAPEKDV